MNAVGERAPKRHAASRLPRSGGLRKVQGGDTKDTSAWLAVGGLLGATVACQRSRGLNGSRGAGASLRFALAAPTSKPTEVVDVKDQNAAVEPYACPLCNRPFSKITGGGAVCDPCGVGFPRSSNTFLDLTISSAKLPEEIPDAEVEAAPEPEDEPGLLQRLPFVEVTDAIAERLGLPQSKEVEALGRELIKEPQRVLASPLQPPGTSTFQSPLVSFAYERGWRRSFASSGFPGPDEEFRLAQEFLKEGAGLLGDCLYVTLIDADCSGSIEKNEFIRPLTRWINESKTAPRFVKYNMERALHQQDEILKQNHHQFRILQARLDDLYEYLNPEGSNTLGAPIPYLQDDKSWYSSPNLPASFPWLDGPEVHQEPGIEQPKEAVAGGPGSPKLLSSEKRRSQLGLGASKPESIAEKLGESTASLGSPDFLQNSQKAKRPSHRFRPSIREHGEAKPSQSEQRTMDLRHI
eukprot:s361_g31.t1